MGKIVVRVYTDENTSKAFGVDDETVGDLSKLMREKLELSEAEGRKWAVVEKKPDGERFPDITEKVQGIVSAWEKEKKKTKGSDTDYQFWWKQKPTENRTIRVYFLDGTFKAVVVNADTTAAQLHEAVVQKIELTKDVNFGLFDQRKKGDRPIPPSENILSIMDDWKRNAKKGDKEEENKFVLRLKTPMQNEDVVEDPVRVHLLYLEVRNAVQQGTLNPSTDDMVLLATLDVQINFGDNNPKVHIEGFLLPKLKELIPKKILGTKKEKEWEKEIYKQHASHKGMRPLFAKLEYLQIVNPSFRASASIVAINKAEQQKRDEEEMMKRGKAQAAKAAAPAAPVAGPAGGPPPPPPAPPAPPKGDEEEDVNAFPSLKELTATTVSARVSSRFDLLSSIEDGVNLKRVGDMNDRSAPKIDTSVKLKKSNRSVLLQEIGKGADLKKSETVDKSAPSIAGAKVKKIDRKGMLEGIEKGDKKLKKTETQDRSAPKFSTKKANRGDVFAEIGQGKKLKKAQTVDKSGAVLDKAVKVKKIDRKGMLDGIEKGAKLKRAETRDASAPVIAKEMKVEIGARQNLLASIEQGANLHHVTDADKIPKGEGVIRRKHPVVASVSRGPKAALGGPPRAPPAPPRHFNAPMPPPPPPPKPVATANRYDILSSIEAGEVRLKKTETVDKSGPKVEGQVKIKKVDRAGLLTEISGEKKLKKAETVDKSGPVTEGVKIKKIDRKGMLDGISKGDAKLKKVETVDKSAPKFKSTKVDRGAIMADLASGEKKLKKTKTVDKSAPVVERVKVKKVDRHGLMRGIEAGIDLKPVDTKDNSGPVIDADVKIKKANDKRGGRGGLLDAIEKGTTLKKVEEDAAK